MLSDEMRLYDVKLYNDLLSTLEPFWLSLQELIRPVMPWKQSQLRYDLGLLFMVLLVAMHH